MNDIDLSVKCRLNIWQDVISHQGLRLKMSWIKHLLDVDLESDIEIAYDEIFDDKLTSELFSQVGHLKWGKKLHIFVFDGKIFLKVVYLIF